MALGAALLHARAVRRSPPDAAAALIEDSLRLAAILVEDAAAEGPMAKAVEAATLTLGARMQAEVGPRLATVQQKIRARLNGPRRFFDDIEAEVTALADDPAAAVALVKRLVGLLKGAVEGLSLNQTRAELAFMVGILEDDLGLSPAYVHGVMLGLLDDVGNRWRAIDGGSDLALRRRLRLAPTLLARLRRLLADHPPPRIDVEPLARAIHRWLVRAGVDKVIAQITCALDAIEQASAAAQAAGAAVGGGAGGSVGAGLVPLPDAAEYAWYASWLLRDEDVPMLAISDIVNPKQFITRLKQPTNDTERYLRARFTDSQRATIDAYQEAGADPGRDLMLLVLAVVNQAMQAGPIYDSDDIDDVTLTEDLDAMRLEFVEDQSLFMYNRRFLEHALAGQIETMSGGFVRWLEKFFLNLVVWPRKQVYVTGDRRFVMCDDIPLHIGDNVAWTDAPMFEGGTRGQMWFDFVHISPAVCEGFAQHLAWPAETGKAIWHLVDLQPGHEIGHGLVGGLEISDAVQQILLGKPLSGYFLERSTAVRNLGKWLDSGFGLKLLALFGGSFQGIHTTAPAGNGFVFWLTVFLGDMIRVSSSALMVNTIRDVILSFITLLNFRGPRDGASTLTSQPSRNHVKQDPILVVSDMLFMLLLTTLYERDDYSVNIWDAGGIGEQRARAMAGYWLGGSIGLGLLSGFAGSLVSQIIAWAEDFELLGKTMGISVAKTFLLFWFMLYVNKENDTGDGTYRPNNPGNFAGYPDREATASPYLLPWAGGTGLYAGQANLGIFSHNFITNQFAGANPAPQQAYGQDFGHDLRQPVQAARGGVVWSFFEARPDSAGPPWNNIIIRHATIDPVHDNFGAGPVQTYGVYGHLANNGVTGAFGFAPGQEQATAGTGTPVNQGDVIALAGDTGVSFHNHLHFHVVPDNGAGQPNLNVTIPMVFEDVGGDGVVKSRTWYRSGNR